MTKKVFIAFGHDPTAHLELEKFLKSLGLEPVILADMDDRGLTIIDKFEHYAAPCEFAFVILSPDDRQLATLHGEDRWRARQNVILELGWFMHHLGRRRVVILHKGAVEIPSDLLGILYLPYDKTIFEVTEKIRQRLAGVGLI